MIEGIFSQMNSLQPASFEDPDEAARFIDFTLNGVFDHQDHEKKINGATHYCYSIEQVEPEKKGCGGCCRQRDKFK